MKIDSYSFGSMKVDGKLYEQDLIIFSDRIKPNWWRKQGHSLAIEDLVEVIAYKPEMLIVGTGASGLMEIPADTKKILKNKNIELIAKPTGEACKIFNKYLQEGKRAVGAFHLTC